MGSRRASTRHDKKEVRGRWSSTTIRGQSRAHHLKAEDEVLHSDEEEQIVRKVDLKANHRQREGDLLHHGRRRHEYEPRIGCDTNEAKHLRRGRIALAGVQSSQGQPTPRKLSLRMMVAWHALAFRDDGGMGLSFKGNQRRSTNLCTWMTVSHVPIELATRGKGRW